MGWAVFSLEMSLRNVCFDPASKPTGLSQMKCFLWWWSLISNVSSLICLSSGVSRWQFCANFYTCLWQRLIYTTFQINICLQWFKIVACSSAYTHPALQIQHQKMDPWSNVWYLCMLYMWNVLFSLHWSLNSNPCKYKAGFCSWMPHLLHSCQYLKLKNWNRADVSCSGQSRLQCWRPFPLQCDLKRASWASTFE